MFLKSASMGKIFLMATMAVQFTACNEAEFFEKEFLTSDYEGESNNGGCLGNCSAPGDGDGLTPGGGDDGDNRGDGGGNDDGGDVTPPSVTYQNITDQFTQNTAQGGNAVDILWVVDSSGSMGGEQASLAYNFDIFIQDFVTKNIDFQMGITTTDDRAGHNGVANGDFNLLNSTAAQADNAAFLDYFAEKIKVGTRGSGREKGLNGAKKFVENYGASWLREDAYLVVVQISDEEDQSSLSTNEYINHLKSLKANDRLVTVHSVVNMGASQRYQAVSNDLNGSVSDIRNNFHDILGNMGGSILNLINSFPLTKNPHNNDIKVFINGTEAVAGWSYDSVSNAVKFLEGQEPLEGSDIELKYEFEVK